MRTVEDVVLEHLTIGLPELTDERLAELAAEYAGLPGLYPAHARHEIERESRWRQKVRRTNQGRRPAAA